MVCDWILGESMSIFFNSVENGFYNTDVYARTEVPLNCREISFERYSELLMGQSEGFAIMADQGGNPINAPQQPSKWHMWSGIAWEITEENKVEWDLSLERLVKEKILDDAKIEYDLVMIEIQTLGRMIQLGRGTEAHREKLQNLELRSFDLYELLNH